MRHYRVKCPMIVQILVDVDISDLQWRPINTVRVRVWGKSSVGGSVNVNISGTINLNGGGSSISLDSIMKDPTFKSEITKIVVKGMKEQNR